MLLLFGSVLIFLGVILAIGGLFGKFPDNWEWVGILIALVGLVMATPSFIQMYWGQPKLIAYFNRSSQGQKRSLIIMLKNLPIEKGMRRKLRVRRDTIQSLEANFLTLEAGSRTIIQPIIQAKIYDHSDGMMKNRVALPPTHSPGVAITIAYWDLQKSKVLLVGDGLRKPMPLKKGAYSIEIVFLIDGENKNIIRKFIVGDKADDLIWVLPNPDREDYRIL